MAEGDAENQHVKVLAFVGKEGGGGNIAFPCYSISLEGLLAGQRRS